MKDNTSTIFEKTMRMCLESKKTSIDPKKAKKAASKRVTEAKKTSRRLRENDYEDEVLPGDPAPGMVDDYDDEVMDDISDVVVVVDPEMDADEISDAAETAQEIIDGTPEGEDPVTDEYVGDMTYTCPICGNTFFSEEEMNEGDECPVCGDTPDAFVAVGEVAPATDEETGDEDLEIDVDSAEEDDEEDEDTLESRNRARKAPRSLFSLDESTFNPFLNKFIRENYKNAKSFVITGATRSGKRLALECKLTFKSGKSKNVTLTVENFKPAKNMILAAREDGSFKSESRGAKVAPFIFKTSMIGRTIRCEAMKYNFITSIKEGKRAQISGNLIKESRRTPSKRTKRSH